MATRIIILFVSLLGFLSICTTSFAPALAEEHHRNMTLSRSLLQDVPIEEILQQKPKNLEPAQRNNSGPTVSDDPSLAGRVSHALDQGNLANILFRLWKTTPHLLVLTGLFIAGAVIAVMLARRMNKALHTSNPDYHSFTWGYCYGWLGLQWLGYTGLVMYHATGDEEALTMLALSFPYLFVLKRQRWAWTATTVLSLNPVIWLINGMYGYNRWHEMVQASPIKAFMSLAGKYRVVLAALAFWTSVVAAYVIIAEPYGSRLSDSEIGHLLKIIVLPILVGMFGQFLFKKVVRHRPNDEEERI